MKLKLALFAAILGIIVLAGCTQQAAEVPNDSSNISFTNIDVQEFDQKLGNKEFFLLRI